jgi:WD40 repeat protein
MSVSAPPASPFKGLAAFDDSELDALFFFGREREREVLVANLLASRLTVLYGESGVGKSSLLAAGVVRSLRSQAPRAAVDLHATWSSGTDGVLDVVADAEEGYLLLDQFEEYFLYHDDDGGLLRDLPELLQTTRVNVLVALREDSLARLDAFKAAIPSVFANQIRLEHLDRAAARSAILGPVDRWNRLTDEHVAVEPELVEAVLDQTGGTRIEAPYLQLVLERIWNAEGAGERRVLRRGTLDRLGGAETIVREHLERALASLDAHEQEVAADMFAHLVTPSGTKIAHQTPDLAEYAGAPEEDVRRVLRKLTNERIVHGVDSSDRYEIFHDVLAEPIRTWQLARQVEAERDAARRRQRRLYGVVAVALVALAIVAGLAVWAFVERGRVEDQARHARARELDARASENLTIDPNESVRLALAAAKREPSSATESVLRLAYFDDHSRLVRHTPTPVTAVAASPDGRLVAAAVAGHGVQLVNARNRRLVRNVPVPGIISGLAFTAGGKSLISTVRTGRAHLWDVVTAKPLPTHGFVAAQTPDLSFRLVPARGELRSAITHVRRLVVAPNGRLAAVVARRKRVSAILFDRGGRTVRVLPRTVIKTLTFSPDGKYLATTGKTGTNLWNATTGRWVRFVRDAKGGANVLAFSPDSRFLATAGNDSAIRIFTVETGERTYYLFGHTNPVKVLAWSPDGRVVASGSPDRKVLLWRLQNLVGAGSLAATLAGSRGTIEALAFTPDSARLVSGDDGDSMRVWDAIPDPLLELLGRNPGPALDARWAGTEAVALWPGVVTTFDTLTRRATHELRPPAGTGLTALGISRAASVIAAGAADGSTYLWSGDGTPLPTRHGSTRVTAVSVSANGKLIAAGDQAGTIAVWPSDGRGREWTAAQRGPIVDVVFSPRGDVVAAAGRAGGAVFSAADGHRLRDLPVPGGLADVEFSPGGAYIGGAGRDGTTRLWFADTGKLYRVPHVHTKPLTAIAFNGNGTVIASAGRDSDVWVYGVRKGLRHLMDRVSFGPLSAVALNSDGRWVAGGAPVSVILWDSANGHAFPYLRGHTDHLTSVSFARGRPTILTSSLDGTVRTFACDFCVGLPTLMHLAEIRLAQTR